MLIACLEGGGVVVDQDLDESGELSVFVDHFLDHVAHEGVDVHPAFGIAELESA